MQIYAIPSNVIHPPADQGVATAGEFSLYKISSSDKNVFDYRDGDEELIIILTPLPLINNSFVFYSTIHWVPVYRFILYNVLYRL